MGLSTKARISLGLAGLCVSVLLVAAMFELIPDRQGAVREGRAALAEALAGASSGWIAADDPHLAQQTLKLVVERNPDLLSAAMRRTDGRVVLTVGTHVDAWVPMEGEYSTDTQLRVPILAGSSHWGDLEFRYTPVTGAGVARFVYHPLVLLIGFVAVGTFFAFYFYMSKALTQLDPSKAVPGRVRSALDTMAEGLLVLERSGRVVLANRSFAALLGTEPDALVGIHPDSLPFEPLEEKAEPSSPPWTRALRSGQDAHGVPLRLRGADGKLRWLTVNCSPVLGGTGKTGGVLVSFDDVTELEQRGRQLREARDEADAANRAKSEFLANMSHEIRTPMNAILGFTELLRRGHARDERKRRSYLKTIHSSGTHLLDLINDILDLSKVESGHFEVEQTACQPYRLVREVLDVLEVKASEKDIALTFAADGALPETIISDPARLRQIVTNLVGNAIKFTDSGQVRVTARLDHLRDGSGPMLAVAVSDTGVGIPEDKLESVFEAFVQADTSVTRQVGGTGLGLSISRRFARAMGGDIGVRSVVGEGSTFTLLLSTGPLEGVRMLSPDQLLEQDDDAAEIVLDTVLFKPARVLVVDDAPENRSLLEVLLSDCQLTLDQAVNGQDALEAMSTTEYDLVLMDMQMPVMDGYAATREARRRGLDVPIIALTAHAMGEFQKKCFEAGCDDFATKPIVMGHLIQTLSRWLELEDAGGRPQLPSGLGEGAYAPQATVPSRSEAALAVSSADTARAHRPEPIKSTLAKNARMHRAIQMFLDRLPEQTQSLQTAADAGDLDQVASLAHWLKGSAGSVGYGEFTKPAADLETLAKGGDQAQVAGAVAAVVAMIYRIESLQGGPAVAAPQAVPPAPASEPLRTPAAADDVAKPVLSNLSGDPRMARIVKLFTDRLSERLPAFAVACETQDFAQLAELGHWLKGSAGSVGFDVFTEPARALEDAAKTLDAAACEAAARTILDLARRIGKFDSTSPDGDADRAA